MTSVRIILSLALLGLALAAPSVKINGNLRSVLSTQATANVFIRMRGGTEQVLANLNGVNFVDRASRLNGVADLLRSHAAESQKAILGFLEKSAVKHTSYWIDNSIFIPNANLELVEKLATFAEIEELYQEHVVELESQVVASDPKPRALQWGVQKIGADRVWASGNTGSGVVVGGIDTGVRYTHQDLSGNYRSSYGWYDPAQKSPNPNDGNGHGTHTMGTIAGANGIGVAPGAQWIACKGCATSSCSQGDLTACGQFMACPHDHLGNNADCSQAPHLVSNSWGGGQGQTWYSGIVDSWIAAGIVPLFSQGNAGPACRSANSPGDLAQAIGIGSTTNTDALSSFSSKGPSNSGLIKPDISAPGSNVQSASNSADNTYATMSGTSMACPHAAGAVALILGARPNLNIEQIKTLLYNNAGRSIVQTGQNCGGINESQFPNNAFGHGRVDVFSSVQAAVAQKY